MSEPSMTVAQLILALEKYPDKFRVYLATPDSESGFYRFVSIGECCIQFGGKEDVRIFPLLEDDGGTS